METQWYCLGARPTYQPSFPCGASVVLVFFRFVSNDSNSWRCQWIAEKLTFPKRYACAERSGLLLAEQRRFKIRFAWFSNKSHCANGNQGWLWLKLIWNGFKRLYCSLSKIFSMVMWWNWLIRYILFFIALFNFREASLSTMYVLGWTPAWANFLLIILHELVMVWYSRFLMAWP